MRTLQSEGKQITRRRGIHSPQSSNSVSTISNNKCSSNEDESEDTTNSSDTECSDKADTTDVPNAYETPKNKFFYENERCNYVPYSPESATYTKRSQSNCGRNIITFMVLFAIGLTLYYSSLLKKQQQIHKSCSFNAFRQKYPIQEEKVWRRLEVGIENILNKRVVSPAVYLFMHEDPGSEKIIKEIAERFSACFGSDLKPVEIESKDFTSKDAVADYGYAIEKYKMKIKEGKVILIANLNEIPPSAARALHTICDAVSPIANEVIIILKLTVPKIEGHAVQSARDALENLWASNLKNNELDALITRVTEDVIVLLS